MVREWFDKDGERWLVRPLRTGGGGQVTNPASEASVEVMSFLNFWGHFQAPNPARLDPHTMPDDLLQEMLDQARLRIGQEPAIADRVESREGAR